MRKTQGNVVDVVGSAGNGTFSKELHVGKSVMNDTHGSKGKSGKGTLKTHKSSSQSHDDNAVYGIMSQSCDNHKGKVGKGHSCSNMSKPNVEIVNNASPSSPRHARLDSLGRGLKLKRKDLRAPVSHGVSPLIAFQKMRHAIVSCITCVYLTI